MRSLLESKINPKNQAPTVIESSSKFDGQQLCRPTDPKFSALKDLNPYSAVSKVQEAGSILKVGFAQPK